MLGAATGSLLYAYQNCSMESRPATVPLTESALSKEELLEDMIVKAPRLLSDEWMLIARQEDTCYGGRIDSLALAPDGLLS